MKPSGPDFTVVTAEVELAQADEADAWLRATFGLEPVQLQKPGADRAWLEIYEEDDVRARLLARAIARDPRVRICACRVCAGRDWASFWKVHFKAVNLGRRLHLRPVWDDSPPPPGRIVLTINPGMSFGTGDHFTTRFCLEMLDDVCQKFRPKSLLDAGTGSGILAVAGARLGVGRGRGFDVDPVAVDCARENARLNGVGRRVRFQAGDVRHVRIDDRFDLVCANLYAGLLLETADRLGAWTGRSLILSGIRELETDAVAERFGLLGFDETARDGDGEWSGLLLERRDGSRKSS